MHDREISYLEEDTHQAGVKLTSRRRQSGDTVFAAIFVLIGVFLLSQIGSQTKWVDSVSLLKQPCFWPAISLGAFLVFSVGYLIQSLRDVGSGALTDNQRILPLDELFNWIRTFEYAAYFLVYVYIVPKIGYLPATLLFCPLLTIRAGYKGIKLPAWSMLAGFIVVLIFKTILNVKLPSGELYSIFPDQIRNFLILYF